MELEPWTFNASSPILIDVTAGITDKGILMFCCNTNYEILLCSMHRIANLMFIYLIQLPM